MATTDDARTTGPLGPKRAGHDRRLDPSHPPLARAREGRMVTGLCAGIASFIGASPTMVRVVFVVGAVVTLGVLVLAYLALSALVPAASA